jgi:hypothetical protein
MTTCEGVPQTLDESARQLGLDLAVPGQTIADAVGQLNVNLAAISCEPAVDAEYVKGSWMSAYLKRGTPPFSRAVRSATGLIIFREESLVEIPSPAGASVEELMQASTEGAVWIDEDASAYRQRVSDQNAGILRGFLGGLAASGYPLADGKRDARAEFNEILDSQWSRGSYHCFPESKVVASIMRKSEISNLTSIVHLAVRIRKFAKGWGYGLAIMRLLPDKIASEIEQQL